MYGDTLLIKEKKEKVNTLKVKRVSIKVLKIILNEKEVKGNEI